MNKKEDLFTNIDQRTIEDIADNFPVLSEEEKERIFAMSERKYNNQINEERAVDLTHLRDTCRGTRMLKKNGLCLH